MYKKFGISDEIINLSNEVEQELKPIFEKIDKTCEYNSLKVLKAFQNNSISEIHFNQTTGYGYGDIGRDTCEKVFAEVLRAEDALVRGQFISGTHALTVALFAYLRPGDTLLSITGKPYDTLDEVIGIVDNPSSLKSYGIKFEKIELINNEFDFNKIEERLKQGHVRLIEIQRSKGYSTRKSITLGQLEKVIKHIRKFDKDVIIMIDNCYCEMVEKTSPLEVGANIIVGSLIKNLGGSLASNGAYICGDKKLIELCSERLNLPGEGLDVGPSLGANKSILQGLYFAPSVVASSLKTAVLASYLLEKLGYAVSPKYNEHRSDIVEAITFRNKDLLVKYVEGIQKYSPIDSNTLPIAAPMPGYDDDIIMASGSFTQGSSIELSCDGPLREPFIAYEQGGVTYSYGKIAIINTIKEMLTEN